MTRTIAVVATVLAFLPGSLTAQESTGGGTDTLGDPLAGRTVFVEKGCIGCHAVWGVGGTLGPELAPAAKGKTFPQIAGMLWSHTPGMIEVMQLRGITRPGFEPAEMADLVAYISYLGYFDDPGDPRQGRVLYEEKGCAACHDVGAGASPERAPLDRYATCFSPSALARDMWNAAGAMRLATEGRSIPPPHLAGRDLADILAWLNVKGRPARPEARHFLLPGNPRTGATLFAERHCNRCHKVGGEGGDQGPDLTRVAHKLSVAQAAGTMWNHAFEMIDATEAAGIPRAPFQDNELADLLAYLFFAAYRDWPGDMEKGRALFQTKGCQNCHGDEKIAWGAALPGADTPPTASPAAILASFWNHAPLMERTMRTAEIPWPRFSGDEMRDLLTLLSARLERKPANPPPPPDGR